MLRVDGALFAVFFKLSRSRFRLPCKNKALCMRPLSFQPHQSNFVIVFKVVLWLKVNDTHKHRTCSTSVLHHYLFFLCEGLSTQVGCFWVRSTVPCFVSCGFFLRCLCCGLPEERPWCSRFVWGDCRHLLSSCHFRPLNDSTLWLPHLGFC